VAGYVKATSSLLSSNSLMVQGRFVGDSSTVGVDLFREGAEESSGRTASG